MLKSKKVLSRLVNEQLKAIHLVFKNMLSDLNLPEYLHSGRRGGSYVGNASVHWRSFGI